MAKSKLNGAVAAFVTRFPTTLADFERMRATSKHTKDWQFVMPHFKKGLYDKTTGDHFKALCNGVNAESSVEGKVADDCVLAAEWVRGIAKEANDPVVSAWHTPRIRKALTYCAKQYGMGRSQLLQAALEQARLQHVNMGSTDTEQ